MNKRKYENTMMIQPRVIRAKDAPAYLGMSREVFNHSVRPFVTVVPVGQQGIGFDRLELDAWWVHYMHCNGRPAMKSMGGTQCQESKLYLDFNLEAESGTLTSDTGIFREDDFEKALALTKLTSNKQKPV